MDLANNKNIFPITLAVIFIALSSWSGINPVSREVWIAEIIPVYGVFLLLVFSYSRFQFSNLAYAFMSVWLFMHTIGAHYTFSNVPFDWFNNLIGSERNHYDRIAHFSVGFYAYAMAEWLTRKQYCGKILASFFGIFFIMSIAASYEIIEWWYAVAEGGDAGIAFLGSQGDVWDAQKDMLADTLGAIFSIAVFHLFSKNK